MAENRVIGRDNGLPWHLPADFKRFKTLTTGHTLIMGRKTFDSIGKALPGRRTIVMTRAPDWQKAGIEVFHDLESAIRAAETDPEVFIAGGADIYRQALPLANRIYLTVVHTQLAGDAFFPEIDLLEWTVAQEERVEADERNAFSFSFRRYERATHT